jgi:hypothetical protein
MGLIEPISGASAGKKPNHLPRSLSNGAIDTIDCPFCFQTFLKWPSTTAISAKPQLDLPYLDTIKFSSSDTR